MGWLSNVRQNIGKALLGEQGEIQEAEATAFRHAVQKSPHWFVVGAPESLLSELDQHLLDLLQRRAAYDVLIGGESGSAAQPSERDRVRAVNESRHMYRYDVISWFGVSLWINLAFGHNVRITPKDERLSEDFKEFWAADRNAPILAQDRIRNKLAREHIKDGELFAVIFASTVDGSATIRTIPTEQIKGGPNGDGLIRKRGDRDTILYYRREFRDGTDNRVIYYPDHMASEDDLSRAEIPNDGRRFEELSGSINLAGLDVPRTVAVVIHFPFDEQNGRGWPLLSPRQTPWSRAFRDFAEDRATVQRNAAIGVEDWTVDGGSRPVSDIRDRFSSSLGRSNSSIETNPAPPPGGPFIHNRSIDRKRMPMNMAASDAEHDGMILYRMASIGVGAYPHYMGFGDTTRMASTYSMELPQLREFNGYQLDWSSFFRKLVRVVATYKTKYGGANYTTIDSEINLDSVIESDVSGVVQAIGSFIRDSLAPMSAVAQPEVMQTVVIELWGLALQVLGVKNGAEIIESARKAAAQQVEDVDQTIDRVVAEIERLVGTNAGEIGKD